LSDDTQTLSQKNGVKRGSVIVRCRQEFTQIGGFGADLEPKWRNKSNGRQVKVKIVFRMCRTVSHNLIMFIIKLFVNKCPYLFRNKTACERSIVRVKIEVVFDTIAYIQSHSGDNAMAFSAKQLYCSG